ncbi:hypothetical protein VPH35_079991 [Triticum aestivum]
MKGCIYFPLLGDGKNICCLLYLVLATLIAITLVLTKCIYSLIHRSLVGKTCGDKNVDNYFRYEFRVILDSLTWLQILLLFHMLVFFFTWTRGLSLAYVVYFSM